MRSTPAAKPTPGGDLMMPPTAHGVSVISIGMFVDGQTAVSWRGPPLPRTHQQFLTDRWWGVRDAPLPRERPGRDRRPGYEQHDRGKRPDLAGPPEQGTSQRPPYARQREERNELSRERAERQQA